MSLIELSRERERVRDLLRFVTLPPPSFLAKVVVEILQASLKTPEACRQQLHRFTFRLHCLRRGASR
jgi:hypothetical protein